MKKRQWLGVLVSLAIIIVATIVSLQLIKKEQNRPLPTRETETVRPDVSVITVSPDTYNARVQAYGASRAHYQITLTSEVTGRVEMVSERLESGQRVSEGEIIAEIENSEYRAALTAAEQTLEAAKVTLLEEERAGIQARSEWLASGLEGDPESELVLRQPQLAQAEAAVDNARAQRDSAAYDLQQTRIRAPFDALVIERHLAPGSFLSAGGEVAMLYSTDYLEVRVALSEREWQNLQQSDALINDLTPVLLTSVETGQHWQGRVRRVEQHLDDAARQRSVVISLESPLSAQPPLYPGTFLQATIQGREMAGLWKLPATALSQRGQIWYLSEDNTLATFNSQPAFIEEDALYIRPPEHLQANPQQVVTQPLNSYQAGMQVTPVQVNND